MWPLNFHYPQAHGAKKKTANYMDEMINAIVSLLKDYLTHSDARIKRDFFGVSTHKELSIEKSKIVEQTLNAVKALHKANATDPMLKLGDILLNSKLQALAYYLQKGERPSQLDLCLDKCLNTFLCQLIKVSGHEDLQEIFKTHLLFHQALATKLIYEEYNKKTSSLCLKHNNNQLTFEALRRFQLQLDECSRAYQAGLADLGFMNQIKPCALSPKIHAQMTAFLNNQRTKIIELEPETCDLKIPDVSKMYEWGITATSKLGAYVRSLNNQLLEVFDQSLDIRLKE